MNIVFVVAFPFPTGEASSARALNLSRLLVYAGHAVHVIADAQGQACGDVPCTYECVGKRADSFMQRQDNARKSIACLREYCKNHAVDTVLTNARSDRYDRIQTICRERGIKLFVESCEWYHFESYKLRLFDPRYWKNQKMILHGFRGADGFISISRYLHAYNQSLGKQSVRIPTIMDVATIPVGRGSSQKKKIQIVYTGNPRISKEYLAPILQLLAANQKIRNRIQFHIYGADAQQVLKNRGVREKWLRAAGDSVVIHGKIPQSAVQGVLMNADYQLFIRPNRRSSHAGFPTKLAESMAVGTPVIANKTGDIALYLCDGENGFIVAGTKTADVEKALLRVIEQKAEDAAMMRRAARKTAEACFDYRAYRPQIKWLFQEEHEYQTE